MTGHSQQNLFSDPRLCQSLMDCCPAQACVLLPDGTIVATNTAWQRFTTTATNASVKKMLLGEDMFKLCNEVHGSMRLPMQALRKGMQDVLTGIHSEFMYDFSCDLDTDQGWFSMHISPLRLDTNGDILGLVLIQKNITDYMKAVRIAQENEKRYRMLADNALDVIYRYELIPQERLEYISPAVTRIAGYTPEELCKNDALLHAMIHPDDPNVWDVLRRSAEPIRIPLRQRWFHKDGKLLWTSHTATPIYDTSGNLVAIEGIARDITSVVEKELLGSQLDRLETIQKMAGKLAHEIRNPLTSLRGFLQLIEEQKLDKNSTRRISNAIIDELDHVNSIVVDYLSLTEDHPFTPSWSNLNQVIHSVYPELVKEAQPSGKTVSLELDHESFALIDQRQISRLLKKLSLNGLEAMTYGGNLTIKTQKNEKGVDLIISDEGKGIESNVINSMGLPFVTTKSNRTGLGLSIVYAIAERHRASISFETCSSGTSFRISFHNRTNQALDGST